MLAARGWCPFAPVHFGVHAHGRVRATLQPQGRRCLLLLGSLAQRPSHAPRHIGGLQPLIFCLQRGNCIRIYRTARHMRSRSMRRPTSRTTSSPSKWIFTRASRSASCKLMLHTANTNAKFFQPLRRCGSGAWTCRGRTLRVMSSSSSTTAYSSSNQA